VSYDLVIAAREAPDWDELALAIDLPDLRGLSGRTPGEHAPDAARHLYREGLSTRTTEVRWDADRAELRIVIRPLASGEDGDLALRVAEAAARLAGASAIEADYFGAIAPAELRRLHNADWMNEQAASGTRALATLIHEGRGPMEVPGPRRSCFIGARLLAELEGAGAADLPERVIATVRRVQWGVPAGFRDAGLFVSGGREGARETRFAVWLPDQDLVLPSVDFVALRILEGEVIVVPAGLVPELAGAHAERLDEVQLLVRAMTEADWRDLVARARPHARMPAK
jgi:hypothetical protein